MEESDSDPQTSARKTKKRKVEESTGKVDKRKTNHGASHRRSYSKEDKLKCIKLRFEENKTTEEIAKIMVTAKSNVEKWCSAKVRKILLDDEDVETAAIVRKKTTEIPKEKNCEIRSERRATLRPRVEAHVDENSADDAKTTRASQKNTPDEDGKQATLSLIRKATNHNEDNASTAPSSNGNVSGLVVEQSDGQAGDPKPPQKRSRLENILFSQPSGLRPDLDIILDRVRQGTRLEAEAVSCLAERMYMGGGSGAGAAAQAVVSGAVPSLSFHCESAGPYVAPTRPPSREVLLDLVEKKLLSKGNAEELAKGKSLRQSLELDPDSDGDELYLGILGAHRARAAAAKRKLEQAKIAGGGGGGFDDCVWAGGAFSNPLHKVQIAVPVPTRIDPRDVEALMAEDRAVQGLLGVGGVAHDPAEIRNKLFMES